MKELFSPETWACLVAIDEDIECQTYHTETPVFSVRAPRRDRDVLFSLFERTHEVIEYTLTTGGKSDSMKFKLRQKA